MAKIKRRTSMGGVGCLLQGLGLVSFVGAVMTIPTVIGPIVFGVLGVWLLFYGSAKSQWLECSDCGSKVRSKRLRLCPDCNSEFS
jgi:hypothetical protein